MRQILFGILLLVGLIAFGNEGVFKYYHLKRFESNLIAKNEKIRVENVALKQEVLGLQNPNTIEKHIRNLLGYVRDNELIYEIGERPAPYYSAIKFLGL